MKEAFEFAGAVLFAFGGGSAVVFALSKHLAAIWAQRTIEREKANIIREQELLVRKRNIYAKLSQTLRVFLASDTPATTEQKNAFLAAYDEAALWASEEVVEALGKFLDLNMQSMNSKESVSQETYKKAFLACVNEMRRDSGFPKTSYQHRMVVF